jgi:hypothetical protein
LVSKIGFFLKPNTLVPYDAFSRRGLKTIRRKLGVSRSKIESYSDYLNEFNAEFKLARLEIRNGLTEPWVRALAKKLKCPIEVLKSEPMQRKVFDYYLMEIGGYRTTSTTLAADLASDDADTGNLAPERVARPCAPVNG